MIKFVFLIFVLFHSLLGQTLQLTILNETLIDGTNAGSFFGQSLAGLDFDAVAVGIPTPNQIQLIFFNPDGTRNLAINPPVLTPAATTTNWGLGMDAGNLNSMNGPDLVISEQGITAPLTFFDLIPLSSIRAGTTPIFSTRSRGTVEPDTAISGAPQKRGIAIGEILLQPPLSDLFTVFLADILPFNSNRFVTGLTLTSDFDEVNEEVATTSVDNSATGGDSAAYFTYNSASTLAVGAPSMNSGNGLVLLSSVSLDNLIGPEVIIQNGFQGLQLPSGTIGFGAGLAAADLNPITPNSGDDLIVGARGLNDEGLIFVLLFNTTGNLIQTIRLVPGTQFNAGDLLGTAFAVTDFENDDVPDLVVSAPGRNSNTGSILTLRLSFCGDVIVSGNERCDDGNIDSGDGCDESCLVEIGWDCDIMQMPSVCTEICGDGMRVGSEISPTVCDDGNLINGDGCDQSCQPESGFSCEQADGDNSMPSNCTAGCGDGSILGGEICDDGNLLDGDGCSDNCLLEEGFICVSIPSVCTAVCGDGMTLGNEECDDGNLDSGDGCDENCFMEVNNSAEEGNDGFPQSALIGIVIGAIVLCCILLVLIGLGIFVITRPKPLTEEQKQQQVQLQILSSNEIPILTEIEIGAVLGQGEFGEVYKGNWRGTPVALKSLKGEHIEEFANELKICSKLRHPHVTGFFGIFVKEEENYMTLEFMDRGDLLTFLHKEGEVGVKKLSTICVEIALGMAHLHETKIIHRDLAARNILLQGEGTTVTAKVADFGLSRIIEDFYESQSRKIPVRWTAPEAIQTLKFDEKCDIWSYGIVVWEVFSRGQVPYPGLSNQEILDKVPEGFRLPPPLESTPTAVNAMRLCWDADPSKRPEFSELAEILKEQNFDEQIQAPYVPQANTSFDNLDVYRQISNLIGNSEAVPSVSPYSQVTSVKGANKSEETEVNQLKQQIVQYEKYFKQYKDEKKKVKALKTEVKELKKRLGEVSESFDSFSE